MFLPGEACVAELGAPGAAKGCCVPGHRCSAAGGGGDGATTIGTCEPLQANELTYDFAAARGAVAGAANAYEAATALSSSSSSPTSSALKDRAGGLTTTTTTTTSGGCAAAAASTAPSSSSWCSERRLLPNDACDPSANPAIECCPDGYSCASSSPDDNNSPQSFQCRLAVTASALSAATEPLAPAAAQAPALRAAIAATAAAAAQCAGAEDGAPLRAETDNVALAAAIAAPAAAATAASLLAFPPPPLPADACSCRVDANGRRVPAPCPTAQDLAAAGAPGGVIPALPPALRVNTLTGVLELDPPSATVAPPLARLRGINWFGWETGQKNFDGLWAYCDDIGGGSSCPPGAQIPPWSDSAPGGPALSSADRDKVKAYFWGKRTSTNDFASVVHALKVLGFNSVRVPFTFAELAAPLPATADGKAPGETSLCMRDDLDQLTLTRLADPALDAAALRSAAANGAAPGFPRYSGAPHPPPPRFWPMDSSTRAKCDLPWEAPLIGGHTDPSTGGSTLRLTTCNWYLPQAPGTAAIHRFLFQIDYLVSQGFYVVLSYHPTAPRDAVTADAQLFANNWGNLWRSLVALPSYATKLRGRVFPDLLNEGSRYGCLYERAALIASGDGAGAPACAPAVQAMMAATMAMRAADPKLPGVLFNGLGQSGTPADVAPNGNADCVAAQTCFPGMPWGDGYITKKSSFSALSAAKASNASALFASSTSQQAATLAALLALSPHAYPSSITGWGLSTQQKSSVYARFNASWGLKVAGRDTLWTGKRLPRRPPALLGEVGMFDDGDNGLTAPNADTTKWRSEDLVWLADVRRYFESAFLRVPAIKATTRVKTGRAASNYPLSWFFWSWNANSMDTKGLIGPFTTWRVVQWTKVKTLVSELGLRPWYCAYAPPGFCGGVAP
jgi:hypothetical protein